MSDNKADDRHFTFEYAESGGLSARYLMISFDSKTNTFTYSTDISGSNLSYKPISDSYKTRTKRYIAKNDFLSLKLITLLKKRIIQSLLYSLVIAIDDKTH